MEQAASRAAEITLIGGLRGKRNKRPWSITQRLHAHEATRQAPASRTTGMTRLPPCPLTRCHHYHPTTLFLHSNDIKSSKWRSRHTCSNKGSKLAPLCYQQVSVLALPTPQVVWSGLSMESTLQCPRTVPQHRAAATRLGHLTAMVPTRTTLRPNTASVEVARRANRCLEIAWRTCMTTHMLHARWEDCVPSGDPGKTRMGDRPTRMQTLITAQSLP